VLAGHVERLPAGSQHGDRRRLPQDRLRQQRAGVDQVLAGVEDQQQLPFPQVLEQRVKGRPRVLLRQAEHARHRVGQQRGVAQFGQLDDPGTVRVTGRGLRGRDQGDTSLADSARSDDRHEPGFRQHRGDSGEFVPPAYEVGVSVVWKSSGH
jgi:hypothetical protein